MSGLERAKLAGHLSAIAADLHGFGGISEFVPRLVGLLALRKLLGQAEHGRTTSGTFSDLMRATDVETTLRRILRTGGSATKTREIYEHLENLLEPLRADERPSLSVAVQGIASIPDDLLGGSAAGHAALRLVVGAAGKRSDAIHPSDGIAGLMVDLAEPPEGGRIMDPHCGAATLLLAAGEWARARGRSLASLEGGDPSVQMAALARAILFLADLPTEIEAANAIVAPGRRQVGPYDVVLSVPPIGLRPPAHLHIQASERFRYGVPARHADWLYAQHGLSLVSEGGVAIILLARGPLFRSGAEAEVRRGLIESDQIDAVIGFPGGLLTGTAIPCALVVLRRTRSAQRRGTITMVEVDDFARGERRADLPAEVCSAVTRAVREGSSGVAAPIQVRLVGKAELAANDHSLLPARYFDVAPEIPARDVASIVRDLHLARARESETAAELADALAALIDATRSAASTSKRN